MIGAIIAVLAIVLAVWVLFAVVKVVFKLVALAIILGLAFAAYLAVRNRIGGGR